MRGSPSFTLSHGALSFSSAAACRQRRWLCGLALIALLLPPRLAAQDQTLIPTNSTWRWRKGTNEVSNPSTAWQLPGFNDTSWLTGAMPFRYGVASATGGTLLSDMRYNYTTIYLRRAFVVTNLATLRSLTLSATIDDGFIAWINGVEVQRFNARAGQQAYNATALSAISPTGVSVTLDNPASFLVPGTNVIAVHGLNANLTSSDFILNLQLTAQPITEVTIASANPVPGASVSALTQVTVTFNTSVTGVDAPDLVLNGQPASTVIGGGATYTFGFPQPEPGLVSLDWDELHGITDLQGNPFNAAAPGATWTYTLADTTPPQVALVTPVAGAQVSQLTQVEVLFSEPVRGLNAADLLLNGQPAASATGAEAGPYRFHFAAAPPGVAQLAWAGGHAITDLAGNSFSDGGWSVTVNPALQIGDVIINEFLAENLNLLLDEDGEAQDWIELRNRGANPVNLLGWSLTDDAARPGKWVFPSRVLAPGEYLVVFASGKDRRAPTGGNRFHTNFKLSGFGEYLALFNAELPRVAASEFAPAYPEQRNNYSYGLDPNGQWRYHAVPTPGAPNNPSSLVGVCPPPHFSVSRGFFDAPFNVLLTTELDGAIIRYTTDGNDPLSVAGRTYSAPITVTNTTILRASVLRSAYLPSRVGTQSYLFLDSVPFQPANPPGFPDNWGANSGFPGGVVPADYEMDQDPLRVNPLDPSSPIDPAKLQRLKDGLRELPVLSIVLTPNDLFGAEGLYPRSSASNKNPNEKPCSLEFILPDGTVGFAQNAGLDLHGNASRDPLKNPKHGFKVKFRSDYGESSLRYRLFPDSPAREHDDLVLRADFNSSWRHWSDTASQGLGAFQRTRATRTRDAWIKASSRDMGNLTSHNRYCHVFFNGLYWGTFDFTEQPTSWFAANEFGGAEEDYDVYDQGALRNGTSTAYQSMLAIGNLASNASYEQMKQALDVPCFSDYMLLHFFVGHQDWGVNKNWYALRKRVSGPEGRFRYLPWDGENYLLNENVNRVPNAGGSTDVPSGLFTKLDDNAQFRLDFADRVHKHLIAPDGALTLAANTARWRYYQALLDQPIVAESCRWGDYRRDVHPYSEGEYYLYTREEFWLPENERILNSYFVNRPATVMNQFVTAGLYPAVAAPEFRQTTTAGPILAGQPVPAGFVVALRNPGGGVIYYTTNGADPRVIYAGSVSPAAAAYTAPLTLTATLTLKARVLSGGVWSALNEATFQVGELGVPLRFTEIHYNPPGGSAHEFVELRNLGNLPLDIGGFSFLGINFTFPNGAVLAPGAVMVLANGENPAAFAARYPGVVVSGWFGGNLSNGGERIAILDRESRTVLAVHYDDEGGWPATADGDGYSLEIIDPRGDPNAPDNWRASFVPHGTPGLPPAPPPVGDVVINELMADNATAVPHAGAFPDWIELHNRGASTVDLGNWSLTDSSLARKFVFPTNTLIPADGYLVVWCDSETSAPGLHTGFSLGRNGETVSLFDASTNRVDALTFGLQLPDYSVGRVNGEWRLTLPTPGAPNTAAPLAAPTELSLNEWMAAPGPGGLDWLEMFNRSSNAPVALRGVYFSTTNALSRYAALSFVAPRGHAQLFAEEMPGADQLEFKLPAAGGAIALHDPAGIEFERITYGPQTSTVSEGRLPDGAANVVAFAGSASPQASNYVLAWTGPVFNEVLARNQRAVLAPWGAYADFIELHNPAPTSYPLAGHALGRSLLGQGRWTFPAGASVPANGYLRVWCDGGRPASTANGADLNTGFSLPGESGDVVLFNPAGQPVDWVGYGFQVVDLPIGRGGGEWQLLSAATPGAPNAAPAALGPATALRINEWMAAPLSGDDWIELYNTSPLPVALGGLLLTDDPSVTGIGRSPIAPLSFIGGQRWVRFIADGNRAAGRDHANFALNRSGETIRLYTADRVLIDAVDFGVQTTGVSQGRVPDGGDIIASFPASATPGGGNYLPLTNLVINEVLTHTDPPYEDAVELLNLSDTPVNIGGWFLSDSASDLKRYRIPDGTVVAPGGFAVFYQYQFGPVDGEDDAPPLFSFNSALGDAVYLSEADAGGNLTGRRVGETFGPAANGVSLGRHLTSVGVDFVAQSQPTLGVANPASLEQFRTGTGATNAGALVGPVVINEIMYHPPAGLATPENPNEEFIELHNFSNNSVPLFDPVHPTNTWRMADAVTFDLPPGVILPPNGYLLVVPFDPAADLVALAAFRARYGTNSALIVGPYSGRLDNAGETVVLLRPDRPQAPPRPDAGYVPYLLVDRVAYLDVEPWPVAADGGGASLQRLAPSLYGNDPAHWKAEAPTAGGSNDPTVNAPPIIVTQPEPRTVIAGQTAVFTVAAQGAEPLAYQWFFNGMPLPARTASQLTLANVQAGAAGDYQARVTNDFGAVFSEPVALTVLVPPWIITQPQHQTVAFGSNALFSVVAGGSAPLAYQWLRDGQPLGGQTTATLVITDVNASHAGTYRVTVTNVAGAVTSGPALLMIGFPPVITLQPVGGLAVRGGAFTFAASATGDAPLTAQWRFNGTDIPGATDPSLTLTGLSEADSGSYTVRFVNPAGSALSAPALLTVVEAPVLLPPAPGPNGERVGLLTGPTNRVHIIEASTNLTQWIELDSFLHPGGWSPWSDPDAPAHQRRYYRARVEE